MSIYEKLGQLLEDEITMKGMTLETESIHNLGEEDIHLTSEASERMDILLEFANLLKWEDITFVFNTEEGVEFANKVEALDETNN